MIIDKRSHKLRLWTFICLLLVLLISVYVKFDPALLSENPLRQVFTTLLFSSYNFTSNNTIEKSLNQAQPLNSIPNEGFVTFSNNNGTYAALLIYLLESVHQFSTRPIFVFGIDADLDINTTRYPRVIKRRLNQTACGQSIYYCKIHAIIESKLDYGVHIDADSLVNWNIDILFDVVRRWPYPFPLAPRHPADPENYNTFLKLFDIGAKNRTMPYVHSQFSWNYRAYPFFKHAFELLRGNTFPGANFDETGINILLWKAKARHTLCKIDPFYLYISDYEAQQKTCTEFCHTAFIILHGLKKEVDMRHTFERLKKHAGLPFIQTPTEGWHYLNETKYTCCYPDSQPSSIHPLICEYPKWNS